MHLIGTAYGKAGKHRCHMWRSCSPVGFCKGDKTRPFSIFWPPKGQADSLHIGHPSNCPLVDPSVLQTLLSRKWVNSYCIINFKLHKWIASSRGVIAHALHITVNRLFPREVHPKTPFLHYNFCFWTFFKNLKNTFDVPFCFKNTCQKSLQKLQYCSSYE